jgi:predicted GNAT superfamily acetyltransferase
VDAARIASAAGIEIVELGDLEAMTTASRLFDDVWGTPGGDSYLAPSLLRALSHAGNYGAAAYEKTGETNPGGALIGAVMGFLGQDGDGTFLHSHILAVSSKRRSGGVGFALKEHQRAWALGHGLRKITWTFDPLVRRNAFFNLHKLGAGAGTYLENFYGDMDDDVNGGDESDRLLVEWRLDDPRVELAASGDLGEIDVATLDASIALDEDGSVADGADVWSDVVVCATPDDVIELRRRDPEAAMRWRRALRSTLGDAMARGYTVTGFARTGWYVLERA